MKVTHKMFGQMKNLKLSPDKKFLKRIVHFDVIPNNIIGED